MRGAVLIRYEIGHLWSTGQLWPGIETVLFELLNPGLHEFVLGLSVVGSGGFICGEKLKVEGYFVLIGKGEATHVLDNITLYYLFVRTLYE